MNRNIGVLLSEQYSSDIDPTNYYLSEKLDGVRAIWDGKHILSRNGNVFPVPDWFVSNLPKDIPLDGELWLGRGVFQRTLSIVTTKAKTKFDSGWRRIKYMVFDIPLRNAGTFEVRQHILKELVQRLNQKHIEYVPQTLCPNRAYFEKAMAHVIGQGGEGLMLRKPNSLYENGRSHTLLKAKKVFDDEAKVIGYEAGEGKNVGKMGAIWCINNKGIKFKLGTGFTDKERENPPPIGCTVTYRYQELSDAGVPIRTSFIAIRNYE